MIVVWGGLGAWGGSKGVATGAVGCCWSSVGAVAAVELWQDPSTPTAGQWSVGGGVLFYQLIQDTL
jgi:hypothetical protein